MTPDPINSLRILVADDDPTNLRLAATILRKLGHRGVILSDGCRALERLEQEPFDVALLDDSMPGLSGTEVVRRIRALELAGRARVALLIVSGHVGADDQQRFCAAGADGFVPKPVDIELLRRALQRVAGR